MAQLPSGPRVSRRSWAAALLAVPTLLAGAALVWPGQQMAAALQQQAQVALRASGVEGVTVDVDGRDARLTGVPPGAEATAERVVAAVPGVRAVHVPDPEVRAVDVPTADARAGQLSPGALRDLVEQLAAIGPVVFDADSAALTPAGADVVQRVARLLVAEPAARVQLDGFIASTPGASEVGVRLSEQRAEAVAAALAAAGVDRSRVTVSGRGSEQQLPTPEASRRVEIRIG